MREMTFVSEEGRTGLFTHSVAEERRFNWEIVPSRRGKTAACTELVEVIRLPAAVVEVEEDPLPPGRQVVGGGVLPETCRRKGAPSKGLAVNRADCGGGAVGTGGGRKNPPRLFTMVVAVLSTLAKKELELKKSSSLLRPCEGR